MLKQVDVIPRTVVSGGSKGHSGGGKFGTLGGLAAGAALGATVAATGGAALPAIALAGAGGAATGASLGGLLGEELDKTKQGTSAIERRLDSTAPQLIHSDRSETLKQSLMALHEAPQEIRDQYAPPLLDAYMTSLHQDNVGGQV